MAVHEKRVFTIPQVEPGLAGDYSVDFRMEANGILRIDPTDSDDTYPVRLADLAEIVRRLTGGPTHDDTAAWRGGVHPHSLNWDKPMTSRQAMRHCTTYGLIPAELYEADMKRLRERVAELESPTPGTTPAPTPEPVRRMVLARSLLGQTALYVDERFVTAGPGFQEIAAAAAGSIITCELWNVRSIDSHWPDTLADLKRVEEVGT